MKKGWVWLVTGLVVAAAVFVGLRVRASSKAAAAAAAQKNRYVTQPVVRGDVSLTVSGSGSVAAAVGVNVKPQQSGTVEKILAKNGDKVQAGQPILVLHNASVVSALTSAQSALQQAQLSLAQALNADPVAVQQAQQKVTTTKNTLNQRQTDASNLTVTAPVAGVVVSTGVQVGDNVNSGGLVANLFDDAHPQAILPVPQYVADAQAVGQSVDLTIDGVAYKQSGKLLAVGPAVSSAGHGTQVPLTYQLTGPIPGLRAGATAHGTVKDSSGSNYEAYGAVSTNTVTVRAQVAGQVTAIPVNIGDRVAAGATLVTLKSDSLQSQLTQAKSDYSIAQAQLDQLLNPGDVPNNNIAQLQLKVKAAQTDLASKQEAVDELTVRSPITGTISGLDLNVGDSVSSGGNSSSSNAAFRVADYGTMTVQIDVDELDISHVKPGEQAQVQLDALPNKTFTAKVTRIDTEGTVKNDIAQFGVELTFDKSDGLLAGMNAVANIVVETHKNVLAVPVAAVTRVGRGYVVRVADDQGQAKAKQVKVGLFGSDLVEITDGLTEGEKVVVADLGGSSSSNSKFLGGGMMSGGAPPGEMGGTVRQSTSGGKRGN